MANGVDYSWGRPSPWCLHLGGITFASRYVGGRSAKNLTRHEADLLRAEGISPVSIWETSKGAMALGAHGGRAARGAYDDALACGMPPDRPIYFALDLDPGGLSSVQWSRVGQFLIDAANELGGRGLVGLYAGREPIRRFVGPHRLAHWGFQAAGWSDGLIAEEAHLVQHRTDVEMCGGTVDLCRSLALDFGQWDRPRPPDPVDVPQPEEPDMIVRRTSDGACLHITGGVAIPILDTHELEAHTAAGIKVIPCGDSQYSQYQALLQRR